MTLRLPEFVPEFGDEESMQRWRDELARLNPEESMSETPLCPVHKTAMRASAKGGGFFCPRKLDDGTYCTQKIKEQPAPANTPPSASVPASGPAASAHADATLAVGCLDFAVHLWGPIDASMHDEVLASAVKAFMTMKKAML
jgi:hypothetical protein